jgi:hypothetical protein
MQEVDVGSIVPSTRDLLQVIGTRRRSLALVGIVAGDSAAADAARLAELNVSALGCAEPGPAMLAAARATRTVPMLCLAPSGERDAFLAARQGGADGVCIDARLPLDAWDRLAQVARSMRMLPIALATDEASVEAAVKSGARAVLVRAPGAAEVIALAGKVPRKLTLVGHVEHADADAVRALAGHVDAAVVPPGVYAAAGFAELVAEVDP